MRQPSAELRARWIENCESDRARIRATTDRANTAPIAAVPAGRRSRSQKTDPAKATTAIATPHHSAAGDDRANNTASPRTASSMIRKKGDGTSWRGIAHSISPVPQIRRIAKKATASGIDGTSAEGEGAIRFRPLPPCGAGEEDSRLDAGHRTTTGPLPPWWQVNKILTASTQMRQ